MSVLVFDTHDFVRRLHDAGFSETQAEVLTRLQQESVNAALEQVHSSEVATKQDLRETELALKHDLREMELKLELKIADTKSELIRWIVGAGFLQTALITALLLKVSSGI
ncbi:coiled-coil domain-containing protein [methanotrophic endosymbiont of Bathymodiolus puteoserpentis (Logatchev)]|uniref:coiled-coil domain-containing protein n=1 Tax=methanotrophic endosymbiont of Bathymodiolus puteoserpentis (Logatchev) TaxID=343235 RepID=UPI0013C8B257|nr:coiled-coil domain-containing protein [methanotrophic endosymbiont of Bathymodiolus puteoserpentis (Logatchev)]SHE19894.1 Phage protein [methanotrophic endosymbiont of Bathymodiolus puteoserpentis (Logatchev)]